MRPSGGDSGGSAGATRRSLRPAVTPASAALPPPLALGYRHPCPEKSLSGHGTGSLMSNWDWMAGGSPGRQRRDEGSYDVMQVCLNGHQISEYAETMPQFGKPFCPNCGAKTITACPECQAPIQGRYETPWVFFVSQTPVPNNCYACGTAYPWRQEALAAAIEAVQLDLDEKDAAEAASLVPAISTDTSRRRGPCDASGLTALTSPSSLTQILADRFRSPAPVRLWPRSGKGRLFRRPPEGLRPSSRSPPREQSFFFRDAHRSPVAPTTAPIRFWRNEPGRMAMAITGASRIGATRLASPIPLRVGPAGGTRLDGTRPGRSERTAPLSSKRRMPSRVYIGRGRSPRLSHASVVCPEVRTPRTCGN